MSTDAFAEQLQSLDHESTVIANYVYAEVAIQHSANQSEKILAQLNRTPTFWLSAQAAFQTAAYIALGRVFDHDSKYNLGELTSAFGKNLDVFSREALAERKRDGADEDPPWLEDYLNKMYIPTDKDVARITRHVERYREIFAKIIKPPRNKYLAHREKRAREEVDQLFARGTRTELWRMSVFLLRLHSALWDLYHNGNKPLLRSVRYSPMRIYNDPGEGNNPHERMVRDVKELMSILADGAA